MREDWIERKTKAAIFKRMYISIGSQEEDYCPEMKASAEHMYISKSGQQPLSVIHARIQLIYTFGLYTLIT